MEQWMNPYPSAQLQAVDAKMASVPTMKDRLEYAVRDAEQRLASRARELFDKNPDLEELLNILQRSNF